MNKKLLIVTFVAASWTFNYQKSITASVIGSGGEPFTITQEFEDMSIDSGNILAEGLDEKYTAETYMTFQLPDVFSDYSLLVDIEEVITDLTGGQCDYENDCEVSLVYSTPTGGCNMINGICWITDDLTGNLQGEEIPCSECPEEVLGEEIELFDGDVWNLNPTITTQNLVLRMSCVKNSCETSRDITVTLTEV